jgi:hypothetical protein
MSAPSNGSEQSDPVESPAVADPTGPDASESADSPVSAETPTSDAPDAPNGSDVPGAPEAPDASDAPHASDASETSDEQPDASQPSESDPRLNEEYRRRLPEQGLTLVGVVHDHPASVHRARAVVRERDPEVVALEAPPLATPLYRAYAGGPHDGNAPTGDSSTEDTHTGDARAGDSAPEDSRAPPSFGGEMSAAVQAAEECDAAVVGIDGPSADFFARLARNCWRERTSARTLHRVASGVASVTRHALVCRAAAAVAERTSLRVEVDSPVDHDCDRTDSPAVQARDERRQAERSQSLLRAFDPPEQVALRDETREECMAAALGEVGSDDETVAVVGLDHLDGVVERLVEE